jgi:Raf kinase inhibitor-like YbhB/YbcL family protein
MLLTSNAFADGSSIPVEYTCDGENLSPPLQWREFPPATVSLALIVDDPDAPRGMWVHWLVCDLPASSVETSEGIPRSQYIPGGAVQGLNDFGHLGYGGPCPPPGPSHRYFFKLYALDRSLDFQPGFHKSTLETAMEGHVLAQARLMGTYQRRPR